MVFIATALASPILAGSDRSTLPGPSVMTNICPTPTITVNTASDSAAVSMPPAPWPPVKATAASQTTAAPRNDQIQGRAASAFASSRRPAG